MAMLMRIGDAGWHDIRHTMSHTGLRRYFIDEAPNMLDRASKEQRLKTIIVIKVYVGGTHDKIMCMMLKMGQPIGQCPFVMIINER